MWLKSLANSININIDQPIIIYEDNTSCKSIAQNYSCHKRSKHFDIKYHFCKHEVEKKTIKIEHVSSKLQLADILTKSLSSIKFKKLRNGLSLE